MKQESKFGRGLTYCIALFLCHSERKLDMFSDESKYMLWFNGATDHLYGLEIPVDLPVILKTRLKTFNDKCFDWRFGQPTKADHTWSIDEAKDLLIEIDTYYGVKAIKAQWD